MFSGIGSQAKALENISAIFEKYFICDNDKEAVVSYNRIHNTNFSTKDITLLNHNDIKIVDKENYLYILTYTYPCTSVSVAGKREGMEKGSNTASSLVWELERILKNLNKLPQVLLMENVTQVHNSKNIFAFNKWQSFLNKLGYINFTADLNAKDFGIPQNRDRCFMVSFLSGDFSQSLSFKFPDKTVFKDALIDYIDMQIEPKRVYPMNRISHLLDNEKFLSNYNPDLKENRICQIGQIYPKSNMLIGRIYSPYGISPTLTTCCGGNHQAKILVKDSRGNPVVRKLSPREYWRLMGFSDDDYNKIVKSRKLSDSQLYKQAGNSIVVPVLEGIFREILIACNTYMYNEVKNAA